MVSEENPVVPVPENDSSVVPFYEEPPKRRVVIGFHWNKPACVTYKSNFGFGVNAYQPMIDYLDAKDRGSVCDKRDIYLPYLSERCMNKYSSEKPFRTYTNSDIDHYIDKGDNIVRQIRQNDALSFGGSCLHRTHTNWSMTKKFVQAMKKSQVVDYRKLREDRLAEDDYYTPLRTRANRNQVVTRQPRSRTPSLPRASQPRSGTPVSTRGGSVACRDRSADKMVQTYDDVLSTLAHSKLDHEMRMASRRERLEELDSQFEDVVSALAQNLSKLNAKSEGLDVPSTCYDGAKTRQQVLDATDNQIFENKLRRQQEFASLNDEINELVANQRAEKMRRAMNTMDYEVDDMNTRLEDLRHRQRSERHADTDAISALTQAAAAYAARKKLGRAIDYDDVQDDDIDYIRTRARRSVTPVVTEETPRRRRKIDPHAAKLSDVQCRVINKVSEMQSGSSAARRIMLRARFVNIYSPRPDTGDKSLIVKPSRTEQNIDSMARSFVERGKMHRRYNIDEEVDPPVSNLNTRQYNYYHNREAHRAITEVPSNSSRVRYAVIRARARNTLLGI